MRRENIIPIQMVKMNLKGCNIGDKGVEAISKQLKSNCSLTTLNLRSEKG